MKELLNSLNIIEQYNKMPLEQIVDEFSRYSGQYISSRIVDKFKFSGLLNIDILTSDYLNQFNIKNLYQVSE